MSYWKVIIPCMLIYKLIIYMYSAIRISTVLYITQMLLQRKNFTTQLFEECVNFIGCHFELVYQFCLDNMKIDSFQTGIERISDENLILHECMIQFVNAVSFFSDEDVNQSKVSLPHRVSYIKSDMKGLK
jgi:hypothetical protein